MPSVAGTHDAARVACALAAGIETRCANRNAITAAYNGDRRARSRFHAGQHGVGGVESLEFASQQGDTSSKRIDDVAGQRVIEGGPGNAERVGGHNRPGVRAGGSRKEVAYELRRCAVCSAAEVVGGALTGSLERDALEGVCSREVFRRDVH